MSERAPEPMVPEHGEPGEPGEPSQPAFGRATIEVEALPDGRRIRYFSWPEDEAGPPPANPETPR